MERRFSFPTTVAWFESERSRSHLSARGRASRSDQIQRNHGLAPGRITRANVRSPQLAGILLDLQSLASIKR
jgi:hypothetical protein